MKAISINSGREETANIGMDDLRNLACMKGLTDEELQDAADFIIRFTEIAYGVFRANEKEEKLAPVINININHPKIKAA